MAERVIALSITVKGTKEETLALQKLQAGFDSVKREIAKVNAEERKGIITSQEASRARAQLNVQLMANRNALLDMQNALLKNNDALKKNSQFVAGIKAGVEQAIPSFNQLASAFGLAFGINEIVSFGKEAVALAAKGEGIRAAFSRIGGEKELQKLRDATRGAVSDIELMAQTLKAGNFGIETGLLAKGMEFAGKVARQTGQDVNFLTESFVTGVGRKSTLILDNLGISALRLQEEVKKMGGDFNKAVENIVNERLAEMGEVAETTADKIARLDTMWQNFKEGIGVATINELDKLKNSLNFVFGNLQDKLNTVGLSAVGKVILENAQRTGKFSDALKATAESIKDLQYEIELAEKEGESTLSERLALQSQIKLSKALRAELDLQNQAKKKAKEVTKEKTKEEIDAEKELAKLFKDGLRGSENGLDSKSFADFFVPEKDVSTIQDRIDKANKELEKTKDLLLQIQEVPSSNLDSIANDFTELEVALAKLSEIVDSDEYKLFKGIAGDGASAIQQIQQNNTDARINQIESEADAQIQAIDRQIEAQKALGISTETLEKTKQALQANTAKQIEDEQRKQFERNKKFSKANALVAGAEAIVKTYSSLGGFNPVSITAALLQAAVTALQIKEIDGAQFAEGGIIPKGGGIIQGRSHAQGGVKFNAGGITHEAQGGEPILVKEAGDDPITRNILSQINVSKGGRAFAKGGIVPAHKYQSGGMIPSFTTRSAAQIAQVLSPQQMLGMINEMIDGKIANIKVTNVATETASTNSKVANIQSDVNFRG